MCRRPVLPCDPDAGLRDVGEATRVGGPGSGADDVLSDQEEHTVYAPPDRLYAVAGGLKERGLATSSIKLVYVPGIVITLTDVYVARQVLRLYDHLDDLDDTQNVSANFEITDEVLEQLSA